VEVTVLKISVVIVTVEEPEGFGHEIGQLVLWVLVTVVVVGGKNISVVEMIVEGEHEDGIGGHDDGNVGQECGPECEPE
jgi:hypothetical protein